MLNLDRRWSAIALVVLFAIVAAIRISPWEHEYGQYTENHLVVVSDRETGFDFPLANNEIVYNPERLLGPAIFHVGTLLSRALGRDGGYDGHVLLHWAILLGTALSVAVIVIQTTTSYSAAALGGVLALLHGRDSYVNWIGVPNNYFYVFCTVAAVAAAVAAFKSRSIPGLLAGTALLIGFQWLALGFYEAPMAVFLVTPVFIGLAFVRRIWTVSTLKAFLCLIYPVIWIVGYVRMASKKDGAVYQKSVVDEMALGSSVTAFFEHVYGALAFWTWPHFVLPGWSALLVVGVCLLAAVVAMRSKTIESDVAFPGRAFLGLLILWTAAIAPFAIVSDTGFLRTHLLAAPFVGASLAVLALVVWRIKKLQFIARTAVIVGVSGYLFFGLASAASCGSTHSSNWAANRAVLREIKRVVPDTAADGLIIVRFDGIDDRERAARVLGNDMWLNMHVRSLYRDKIVDGAGMGLWESDRWTLKNGEWMFIGGFLVPADERISNDQAIVLNVVDYEIDDAGDWKIRMEVDPNSRGTIVDRELRDEEMRRLDLL